MALACKNCGGNILLTSTSDALVCDACGAEQSLTTFLADVPDCSIYRQDEVSQKAIDTYRRGVSLMSSARTEGSFAFAAGVFEQVPDVLNADDLARECRERAALLKSERIYTGAITDMQSDDPMKIEAAIRAFTSLKGYKDSAEKMDKCIPLLSAARIKHQKAAEEEERQQRKRESQRKAKAARKKLVKSFARIVVVLAAIGAVIGYFFVYSPKHIKIQMTPHAGSFVTREHNNYVFCFDVIVGNDGLLDVCAVEGTVVFEKDDEVLVDTAISFSNYSSAAVRAGKTAKFNWELTVYSADTALSLYQTDFDELDVRFDITAITYTNGKTKNY